MRTARNLIEESIDRHGSMSMRELRDRTGIPLLAIYTRVEQSDDIELRGFEVREV